jgi:hypothetical protein
MPGSTFTLAEYPFEMVELACEKCGRHGRMRKSRLIERYGPDVGVADLRETLAQCELMGRMYDPCGAYFVGLLEWWKKQPYEGG